MTLHSAKGLDFETVFLPGMGLNAAFLEAGKAERNVDKIRRLLFVALTRSRCELFVSFSGEGLHETMAMLPGLDMVTFFKQPSENEDDRIVEDWI